MPALLELLTFDVPVLVGLVIVDGIDPNKPGFMVCFSPTPLGLAIRIGWVAWSVYAIVRLRE